MKGAYLVSQAPNLFDVVSEYASTLRDIAVERADGTVQLRDSTDRLLTVFDCASGEWEDSLAGFGEGVGPSSGKFESLWIECRFTELFCRVVEGVALRIAEPTWVVDGNSIVWDARRLDTQRLQL